MNDVARPAEIANKLSSACDALRFDEALWVYNPLQYAREPASKYLEQHGQGQKKYVWLGMNPGPFGMMQTGVPFGDVAMVRDFVGIQAPVTQPARIHPKRPIEGFACTRSEVSGTRLWSMIRNRNPNAEDFFANNIVWNYCPLVFLNDRGANVTPDKLSKAERDAIELVCDRALRDLLAYWKPEIAIGVGAFARDCLKRCTDGTCRVETILHPSPASPKANKDWAGTATAQLHAFGWR